MRATACPARISAESEATLGVRELLRFEADRAWQLYEEGAALFGLIDPDSRGALVAAGAHVQRTVGAHRVAGFCCVWRARAALEAGKNDVHRQGAIRAPIRKRISLKSVIVIGGGLAGLSAGVALAEAGWRVRLFEQRPFLGGRATSYVLPDGEHVDNCQHVTLGCCTNLEDFYRRVGSAGKIKFFDRLLFLDPQGRRGEMQAGMLPAPFHMTGSFAHLFASRLDGQARHRARHAMRFLQQRRPSARLDEPGGISMLEWLRRRKQTPAAIERFWRVVLVSALEKSSTTSTRATASTFSGKPFFRTRTGYRMGVPAVPLGELYDGCKAAIEQRAGKCILRIAGPRIRIEDGKLTAVHFDAGREESADAYVLALPHHALAELLPESVKKRDTGSRQSRQNNRRAHHRRAFLV